MLFEMFWNDFFARQMGVNFSSSGLRSLFSFKFHSVCNLNNYTDNSDFHWYLNGKNYVYIILRKIYFLIT